MRLYLVWASCLVDTCVLRWLVVAHGEREAWEKGYSLVRKCSVADEGTWDVKRVTSAIKAVEYMQQGGEYMRIINGVSYECYERLADGLTSRFAKTVLPMEGDLLSVELNDSAIIKSYDDAILIDIGGNKEFLSIGEFIDIQIK